MKKICFVCYANACRSIMAEAIFKSVMHDEFTVYSAGLRPLGMVPEETLKVIRSNKLDVNGLFSKGFKSIHIEELDYMIVLDPYVSISERVVFIMRDYTKLEMITWDVSDPYSGSINDYKNTFCFLENKISDFVKEIKTR